MLCFRLFALVLLALGVLFFGMPAARADDDMTARGRKFVKDHETRFRPLDLAGNLAWWAAENSGNKDDFAKKDDAQNKIDEFLADPNLFKEVKELHLHRKDIEDAVTARAVDVLFLQYLEKQVDTALLKKMTAKSNAIEKAFNEYRA
jgi:peptidyl-dipeptidase A